MHHRNICNVRHAQSRNICNICTVLWPQDIQGNPDLHWPLHTNPAFDLREESGDKVMAWPVAGGVEGVATADLATELDERVSRLTGALQA